MACAKCGSTNIGVQRSLRWANPVRFWKSSKRGHHSDSNLFRGTTIIKTIAAFTVLFGCLPLLLEGTTNGCHSLEKKVISTFTLDPRLAQFSGLGILAAQYSGGKAAEAAIYYSGSKVPPIIACPALYWKYMFVPNSLSKDLTEGIERFGIPFN